MNDVRTLAQGVILSAYTGGPTPFAGCVLFARDGDSVEAARACSDAVRGSKGLAPIVAVDQEGGRVTRLRKGVESIPSMMALGATGDVDLAVRAGAATAHDLRRAGCTVDFAPVLDLAVEPANTVIGTRSFGADPEMVARMGAAFARGLRDGGIMPTYKHVPGHGSTDVDSHRGLPRIMAKKAQLRARDFRPFERCASDEAAMMVSHVVVEAFDPKHPASLSRHVLFGLLREAWHFRGVAFTDCMQMDAIANGIGTIEGVCAAIQAGADCVLVSHDVVLAMACADALVDRVANGRIPVARLREAYNRVSTLRRASVAPLPLDTPPPHPGIGREIARRAVTVVRGSAHAVAGETMVVSFEGDTFDGAGGVNAVPSLTTQVPGLLERRASLAPRADERASIVADVRASGRRALILARRAHLHPEQALAINELLAVDADALVVSAREPFDIPTFGLAHNVVAIYGDEAVSLAGLADVIFHR